MIAIILTAAWVIVFCRWDVIGNHTRIAACVRSLCFWLAITGAVLIWIFDMAVFGDVMAQLRNNGYPADYGKAICMWKRGECERMESDACLDSL